jgi:PIN domain nuclease of toxin-antitoxin system
MSLLLDSHALLWALHAPEKLAPGARAAIADGNQPVFYSAASVWELAIKSSKGLLRIDGDLLAAIGDARLVELPVRAAHAWAVRRLPPIHADPFDRLLVAQAQVDRLTLVSRDRFLEEYRIPLMLA